MMAGWMLKASANWTARFFADVDAAVFEQADVFGVETRLFGQLLLRPAFQLAQQPNHLTGRQRRVLLRRNKFSILFHHAG